MASRPVIGLRGSALGLHMPNKCWTRLKTAELPRDSVSGLARCLAGTRGGRDGLRDRPGSRAHLVRYRAGRGESKCTWILITLEGGDDLGFCSRFRRKHRHNGAAQRSAVLACDSEMMRIPGWPTWDDGRSTSLETRLMKLRRRDGQQGMHDVRNWRSGSLLGNSGPLTLRRCGAAGVTMLGSVASPSIRKNCKSLLPRRRLG